MWYLCSVLCLPLLAAAADKTLYRVTPLGTLGGPTSQASALNDAGQIAGWSDVLPGVPPDQNTTHAFLFDSSIHDLGTLGGDFSRANAINDDQVIVGSSADSTGAEFPFVWSRGTMLPVPITVPDMLGGQAMSVNRFGTITGGLQTIVPILPFVQTAHGTTLLSVNDYGTGVRVNARNHVAGYSFAVTATERAFVYEHSVVFLFSEPGMVSRALGLNDAGEVVGMVVVENRYRPFVWRAGRVRLLPSFSPHAEASGINLRGQIVGWASELPNTPAARHGVIWEHGVAHNLNDLLEAGSRGDWVITEARDINRSGQIAAEGFSPTSGTQALRLDPVHAPL